MPYNGNVKSGGGEQPQIAGSVTRNTYRPSVLFGPGKQAAPQHFSKARYDKEGDSGPVAKAEPYDRSKHTGVDKEARVHFQSKHHEVAHNETEKEGASPQPRMSEYRQKFDIGSGLRTD